MTDIVDRLRSLNADFLHEEAADEIERLRAERDRLRGVLEEIETPPVDVIGHGSWEAVEWMIQRAADALKAPTP